MVEIWVETALLLCSLSLSVAFLRWLAKLWSKMKMKMKLELRLGLVLCLPRAPYTECDADTQDSWVQNREQVDGNRQRATVGGVKKLCGSHRRQSPVKSSPIKSRAQITDPCP